MIEHKLIFTSLAVLAVLAFTMPATAQMAEVTFGPYGPFPETYYSLINAGLTPGIGSWGGYSIFGPFGLYDQYGLFGAHGLFGPHGPGYGNGLGFGGFGMHDPLALLKLKAQGVTV
ncbi:hypothetical protein [Methanocella arvoryzae]|uniref:Uncharacterized protein n=1 Tax=Methanocella arvoryzae (strain DSM 22066 / NBRC 105507 / MRE50) TaxID=351160 RepID=Q0W0J8_METAR|nr:hypothetical protein [Methanocella arvoryzae]CAJ38095.1 hypothetical protein RRC382 [Methanocella arvoryzae MRE50]